VIILSKKTKRKVVLDCANVACHFLQNINSLGDGLGAVEAYKYWKNEGHDVKVFVLQRKLRNLRDPDHVMANIETFESEIPQKDRVIIPVSGDDDAYMLSWAMSKNAIIVTNDLFRDHRLKLKGNKLKEFDKWYKNGRCGFIFVDDEFIPNPQFEDKLEIVQGIDSDEPAEKSQSSPTVAAAKKAEEKLNKAEAAEAKKLAKAEKKAEREALAALKAQNPRPKGRAPKGKTWSYEDGEWIEKHPSLRLDDEEVESLSRLKLSEKMQLFKELEQLVKDRRNQRNEENSKVKEEVKLRNSINAQVKEHIIEVKKLKEERDKLNQLVKKSKADRKEIDVELRRIRIEGNPKDIEKVERKQEKSHKKVMSSVKKAQQKHDKMIEINAQVDELRDEANNAQQSKQRLTKNSDEFHKKYLESLYKKFALMDLIESEQASTVKIDLSNLLKKKYDLPIIRAKTINVIDGPIFSELNTTLKEALSEFNSKTGRRKHMADRANVRYIVRSNNRLQISATEGFFLGFVRENRKQIIEAFINKYKMDSLRLRIHKSKE
jgi:uncharacterized coiled-coil DUF342 family protein